MAGLGAASRQVLPHIARMPEMELAAGADIRPDALQAFAARYRARPFQASRAPRVTGRILFMESSYGIVFL
jgi:predicted dehydrogenase